MDSPETGSRTWRLSLAIAGAAVLCLVLATRVFVSFDARRAKLVKSTVTSVEGLVRVETAFDRRVASFDAPVAVIAAVRNTGTSAEAFSIEADGRFVCAAIVPAGALQRLDCVVVDGWQRGADHEFQLRGSPHAWELDYFELASHHGSSTRGLFLLVLPDISSSYTRAGPWTIAVTGLILALVGAVPVRRLWSRRATIVHRVLSVTVILVLLAVAISPWVSSFRVLLSPWSFGKLAAILLAPQLIHLGGVAWQWIQMWLRRYPQWRPLVAAATSAAVVLLAYGLVVRSTARELDGHYSGLLRVSERTFDGVPFLHNRADVRQSLMLIPDGGYDAQFQYFAMFDPLMRLYSSTPQLYRQVVDAPPYRFGRIGFPLLARMLAGDRWQLYPGTMVALVWVSVGLSALALAFLAQRAGSSAAWGLLVLAIPGFWQSVRVTLPEPIAAALLLFGYLCVLSKRTWLATILFAASLLVRETGMVLVLAIVAFTSARDLSPRSRALLLCSALPVVAWRIYVSAVLWPDWGWSGLIYSPNVMTFPFVGLAGLWADLAGGQHHPEAPDLIWGAYWFALLLVVVAVAAWPVARATNRVVGAALVVYAVMAMSFSNPTVWSHVANGQRASYEVFMMLAVATVTFHRYSPVVRGVLATSWGGAVLYLLYGAHDALSTRGALFPSI